MKNCRETNLEGRTKFVEELAAQALEDFRAKLEDKFGTTEETWCRHHLAKALLKGKIRPSHAKEWKEIAASLTSR